MASSVTGRCLVSLHDMVRMEESVDMSASWAQSQARVVSMRMKWHASRSQSAPLGSLRRSALLVSMSWTPRSDGVSCPVPVILSSSVVSHWVPVVVQLLFPSRGTQVRKSSKMFFPRQYSTQPGWKFGKKDDAGSQLSWALEKPSQWAFHCRTPSFFLGSCGRKPTILSQIHSSGLDRSVDRSCLL